MELLHYIRLIRQRLWLILLVAALFGGTGFVISRSQEPIYEAESTVLIGGAIQSVNPDPSQIQTSIELVQVYAVLVKTQPILQSTIDTLGIRMTPRELSEATTVSVITDTPLLVVRVRYNNPTLAAQIANTLVDQLVLTGPGNLSEEEQEQLNFLHDQIDRLSTQLDSTRAQLDLVNQQIEATTNEVDFDRLMDQRNILVTQVNEASFAIAEFSSTLADLQKRSNVLEVVEYAQVPLDASNTSTAVVMLLGAIVGGALAAGAALLADYMDETIHSPGDVRAFLQLPVLGTLSAYGSRSKKSDKNLVTVKYPLSAQAEQYRMLQASLIAETAASKAVYVVTSLQEGVSKAVTTANLGVAMASAGLKVLLIDINLRQPQLHHYFAISNEQGVVSLLTRDSAQSTVSEASVSQAPTDVLPRILVVEDDLDTLNLLSAQLKRAGFESIPTSDGHAAFSALETEQPHLVILDVMLPDISGYDICQQIREHHASNQLPIIMLSALGGRVEDRIHGLNVGANDFMAKPYTGEELVARVRTLLNFSHLQTNGKVNLPEVAKACIFETSIPNLWVIPAGTSDERASLLDSVSLLHQFKDWTKVLQSHLRVDVILFNAPACTVSADSSVVAVATDAEVLLVLENDRTTRSAVSEALTQFQHQSVNVKGIVLYKSR